MCYPSLHAIWAHRISHRFWKSGLKLLARWISQLMRGPTGIEIHPGAAVGRNVLIDHGMGVVIGAGAKVLGAITIGANSRIGANAVVVKSSPPNSVVVGVPGQVLVREHVPHTPHEKEDLEHGRLPDTIGETLAALILHVESLEKRVNGGAYGPALHPPEDGVWHWSDFSI